MYGYDANYNYVPFKHGSIVNCRSKKHLLKGSVANNTKIIDVDTMIQQKLKEQKQLMYAFNQQRKEYQKIIDTCKQKCKRKIIDIDQRMKIYGVA